MALASTNVTYTSEQSLAIEAYKKVLQNQEDFFSGFSGNSEKNKKYLHGFLEDEAGPGYTFNLIQFAILDMDGDKIPEVVLKLKIGNDCADFREVLHYYNGDVYGYLFGIRSLNSLKTDGAFFASSDASTTYCSKLRFFKNTYEIEILGYSKANSYFINNAPVTEEAFRSFITEQREKKDVVWYEFSQENIETIH
jgi:hypothetical protein